VPEPTKPTELAAPATRAELDALLKRARAGDKSTVPALRKLLQDPATVRVFGGDLAEQVEQSFVGGIARDDIAWREALTRKLELLRTELLGPSPSPVERLLVERVVACWLQVQDAEIRFAQNQTKLSIQQGDYHQRRMDAANRRYPAALKTLALVRKLAVPALQINVARKQVNVAGGVVAAPGAI
jgi:hypothetical protein